MLTIARKRKTEASIVNSSVATTSETKTSKPTSSTIANNSNMTSPTPVPITTANNSKDAPAAKVINNNDNALSLLCNYPSDDEDDT